MPHSEKETHFLSQAEHSTTMAVPSSSSAAHVITPKFDQPLQMRASVSSAPSQYPDAIQSPYSRRLAFTLPIRHHRLTSPGGLYRPRTRHMSLAAVPSFHPPSIASTDIFYNNSTLPNGSNDFQIRNCSDLLRAVRVRPEETLAKIRAMGNENIRLNDDFLKVKQELGQNREREARHAEALNATIHELFDVESSMHGILYATIDRLENEVCQLRGGGRIVQGVWLDDEEFAAASQVISKGDATWHDYVTGKLACYQAFGDVSDGSEEEQNIEGNGNQKARSQNMKEKIRPAWNPNAQSFTPSAASNSPIRSDITEVFSPVITSPERVFITVQDATIPPTPSYASFLHPHPALPSMASPVTSGITHLGAESRCPPFTAVPASAPKCRFPCRTPLEASPPSSHPSTSVGSHTSSEQPVPCQVMPDAVLILISDSLPSFFRLICPFSLTGLQDCPRLDCSMKKLCKDYNDEKYNNTFSWQLPGSVEIGEYDESDQEPSSNPKSDISKQNLTPNKAESKQSWQTPRKNKAKDNTPCKDMAFAPSKASYIGREKEEICHNKSCKDVHQYATCIDDMSVENGGIGGMDDKCDGCPNRENSHNRKRVHLKICRAEEWKMREVVAGLRGVHQMGRYL